MLSEEEKRQLLSRYSERLRRYGATPDALGWNKPKHRLRYRMLLEYWSGGGAGAAIHLLDFGCGFGDLFSYAQARGIPLDYTGIDINPDLVAVARERYPGARILCGDLTANAPNEIFDVVVASGVHNYRVANNISLIRESMELFDRVSRHGFSMNFLSNRVNYRHDENYYASPEEIIGMAFQHSSRVALRHDYMPFEFTVHVDKRAKIDPDLTVFEPFVEDCS